MRDDMMRDLTRLLGQHEFGSPEELNAFLQREVVGKPLRRVEPTTDRERAEDLVVAARQERSLPKLRAQLAKALALDTDCVAAHLLLAEVSESPAEALGHCRDSIASGDRVLSDLPKEHAVSLWHHPIGRQQLHARYLYAELLWQTGDRQAALDEARAILRLNAGDNQGMRYVLLEWLMRAGSVAEIDALLATYDERSATWMFTTALHRYRTRGPGPEATKALRAAMHANVHVVPMLLGASSLPDELPDMYGIGDEDEAAVYIHSSYSTWHDAVGSIEWLAGVSRATPGGGTGGRKRR